MNFLVLNTTVGVPKFALSFNLDSNNLRRSKQSSVALLLLAGFIIHFCQIIPVQKPEKHSDSVRRARNAGSASGEGGARFYFD